MEMNKFEEQVFFTTTRITIPSEDGITSSIGTGFILIVPLGDKNNSSVTLLISNKHVFQNPKGNIVFNFNKKKEDGSPDFGNLHTFTAKDFSAIYTEHPDKEIDLACINASDITRTEHNIYFRNLTLDFLSDFSEEFLYPGLDIWFVGYPDNRFDAANNLPLLRRGYISSIPKLNFNSKKQFVIDAQVFQGSSGSPVFAPIDGQFKLIGVVTETMIKHGQLQAIPALQTTLGVQQILGLGIVIKSTSLKELIDVAIQKINDNLNKNEPTVE